MERMSEHVIMATNSTEPTRIASQVSQNTTQRQKCAVVRTADRHTTTLAHHLMGESENGFEAPSSRIRLFKRVGHNLRFGQLTGRSVVIVAHSNNARESAKAVQSFLGALISFFPCVCYYDPGP